MSSLHQDRLLVEGSDPVTGAAPILATVRRNSRRPAEEKAISTVPTPRPGTAQRSGTTQTTAGTAAPAARGRRTSAADGAAAATRKAGAPASRTKAASAKAASAKAASAKAASAKAASAKAASAKAASAKAETTTTAKATSAKATTAKAKATTAKATTAKATTAKAKATTAKATTAKATTAKATTAKAKATTAKAKATTAEAKATTAEATTGKATTAKAPAAEPAVGTVTAATNPTTEKVAAFALARSGRPTPHKRTPAADAVTPVADAAIPVAERVEAATEVTAQAPAVAAEGRWSRLLRRRPPSVARRPALYLAAALVGAMAVSTVTIAEPSARATETASRSVSVAQELGIEASPAEAITDTDATELLGELAVSRNVRDAEQAAAAEVQAEADRVAAAAAAEAARPKAVLPVDGARLTSGFGARWGTLHAGIDLAAPMHTPEYAAMDGVVLEAGPASGYGLAVYIQHENGDVTVYGHMDSILVEPGQVVRAGDTIALLGNRGQSTGPHLHFEVHVGGLNGAKVDPIPWLRDKGVAI
ncbi:M23 family metallopeptidase [Blastococcus deserti]|uniref:M23 family metallopeptidase n=1 Tax=Blastococcus deserti TaxID=2259033 RepID=A0ABW4XH53_9ACTN